VPHKLVMTRQVRDWLRALRSGDPVTRRLVAEAIDHLLDDGPALGRPLADRITGSACTISKSCGQVPAVPAKYGSCSSSTQRATRCC
jgi:hypothetical protein